MERRHFTMGPGQEIAAMAAGDKSRPAAWRGSVFLVLKIAVSAALLYAIFLLVDVHAALKAAKGMNLLFLGLAAMVRITVFSLDALRLSWMTPIPGLAYVQHLRLALRGAFFSQLGFGFLTGDAYRAAGYAKGSGNLSGPAAHLLAARFAGISTTAALALAAALILLTRQSGVLRSFAGHIGLGVAAGAVIVLSLIWLVFKVLRPHVSSQWQTRLQQGVTALQSLTARVWALSLVLVLLRGFSLWLVFAGLHYSLSYFVTLLAVVTATLVTLVPLAFAGLGLREGTLAGVCTLFGAPAALSVSAAILMRLAVISAAATGFAVSLGLPEMKKHS